MQFVFNGSVEELKNAIRTKSVQMHRDIYLIHDEPDVLKIGFQRLGHSGGRFFVANISEENGNVILAGTIENLTTPMSSTRTRGFIEEVRDILLAYVIIYFILAPIPWGAWAVFGYPHPWITFLIPAVIILYFQLLPIFRKTEPDFEVADNRFLQFMAVVTGENNAIPINTQELYKMLLDTQGLHSFPRIKDDMIEWELYDHVCVQASIFENDTIIDIIDKNPLRGSHMHWHPDLEDMYNELCTIGKKGNVLVLRKVINGTEIYYYGEPDGYRFPPEKKWHWGRLIYLTQK